MRDIKEHQQIWSISFFIKKQDQEGISVNEQLAEELHKPGTKKFKKEEESLPDLKTMFGQQIQLKCDHFL